MSIDIPKEMMEKFNEAFEKKEYDVVDTVINDFYSGGNIRKTKEIIKMKPVGALRMQRLLGDVVIEIYIKFHDKELQKQGREYLLKGLGLKEASGEKA